MPRLFLPILFNFFAVSSYSQELIQVKFSGGATLSSFSFITDQQIIIKISEEGQVLEWGTEWDRRRYNYYPGKLQPYMGRVDYYGPEADSILRGKLKSIGTCMLSYYGPYETATKTGKLRSIGTIALDYYDNYENPALKGKLKFAGSVLFSYYSSYENDAFQGKLKSVGNTPITYYSTFDDKLIKGKIKSIGMSSYTWYSSNDSKGYQGGLKSGSIEQHLNGITYIIM